MHALTPTSTYARERNWDNHICLPGKRQKMSESERKVWKHRSAEYLLKRLKSIQKKQKNAISQYEVPIRWKYRAGSSEFTSQTIPHAALLRFRKYLFSRKMTHHFFYPKLTDPEDQSTSGSNKICNDSSSGKSESVEKNDLFGINSEYLVDNRNSPQAVYNKLPEEKVAVEDSNDMRCQEYSKVEYDLIDISSDNDMEYTSDRMTGGVFHRQTSDDHARNGNTKEFCKTSNRRPSPDLFEMEIEACERELQEPNGIPCPVCSKSFPSLQIEDHATRCAAAFYED